MLSGTFPPYVPRRMCNIEYPIVFSDEISKVEVRKINKSGNF